MNLMVEVMKGVAEELTGILRRRFRLCFRKRSMSQMVIRSPIYLNAHRANNCSRFHQPLARNPPSVDRTNGALSFCTSISNRVHGRSPVILSFLTMYTSWLTRISTSPATSTTPHPHPPAQKKMKTSSERKSAHKPESKTAFSAKRTHHCAGWRLPSSNAPSNPHPNPPPPLSLDDKLFSSSARSGLLPPKRQGEDANANAIISLSWFRKELIPKLHASIAHATTASPLLTVTTLL